MLRVKDCPLICTGELSELTGKISELNLEVNRMQKGELESKGQLLEVGRSMDGYKQESERLLAENGSLQARLDAAAADAKRERTLRLAGEAERAATEVRIIWND